MTTKRRRRFTADLEKRVGLEALRGDRTVQAIAARHEVHPNQVSVWKRQAVDGLDEIFASGTASRQSEHETTIRDLPTTTEGLGHDRRETLPRGREANRQRLLAHWEELVDALPPDLEHRRPCLLGRPEAFCDQAAPASYFNDRTGHDPPRMGRRA